MKRLFATAVLGIAALGLANGRAYAWWPFSCHQCSVCVTCRQYNAFSPYCCDCVPGGQPLSGWTPNGGWNGAGCPGYSFQGTEGYMGELPATTAIDEKSGLGAPGTAPLPAGPVPGGPEATTAPGGVRVTPQGMSSQGWPNASPMLMNSAGGPAYYPGWQPYGPVNGMVPQGR